MTGTIAIVPLRNGTTGKTRLADSLSSDERTHLIVSMAHHVVYTLLASDVIASVLVVTRDLDFAGRNLGSIDDRVHVIRQPDVAVGLNGALAASREWVISHAASSMLIAPADLPLLGPDDVRRLVADKARVVIAPDRHRDGTNALLLRFGDLAVGMHDENQEFVFQFGKGSYAAHVAEAQRLGWAVSTSIMHGTEHDLDTIDDWNSLPAGIRAELQGDIPQRPDGDPLQNMEAGFSGSANRATSATWSQ